MKLADFVAQRLAEYGVRHIFMVTGGGAMHPNDSLRPIIITSTLHDCAIAERIRCSGCLTQSLLCGL